MSQTTEGRPERVAPPSSSPGEPALALDDPCVIGALEEYRAVLEAGGKPDRQAFQARHPELSQALAECLAWLDFIHLAAPQLQSAAETCSAEVQPEGPLGDYRIVREIGRGGMGVVYEAVQISLGRRVALKVLPFAAALDAKQLQRFKNEAQAAAHLHHTNIVPVFGIGCERSVHFYAMQFIDGQTLAALIQQMRTLAGLASQEPSAPAGPVAGLVRELASGRWAAPPRPSADPQPTGPYRPVPEAPAAETAIQPAAVVSTEHSVKSPAFYRTVAQLGRQAAEALEHAHQLGVVHRDIKPANLLVDGRGNLWITDFGLAHCQSQAGLTMTGDLVGTLRYMSPEQALAKRVVIDHRTDVYSLGATLYELLTLEPAFNGRDRQELLRQIAFEEPRPPRRLSQAIPPELETVVLKAMEKNPADRYATARELADDLERYLKDEPIRARRASLVQRARKFAVRHRPVVVTLGTALVLFLVASVVALAVSNMLISREEKQKTDALGDKEEALREKEAALTTANDRRLEAEKALQLVLEALDEVYLKEFEKRLTFHQSEERKRLLPDSSRERLERDFLEKGVKFYQRLAERPTMNAPACFDTAKAYRRVAGLQLRLGRVDKSEEAFRKAIALLEKLAQGAPQVADYGVELAETSYSLCVPLREQSRFAEAEKVVRQGLVLFEQLALQFPEDRRVPEGLLHCFRHLGLILPNVHRDREAEQALERALAIGEELVSAVPLEPRYRRCQAESLHQLCDLFRVTNRPADAEQACRKAVRIWENLAKQYPTTGEFGAGRAGELHRFAELLSIQKKLPEAEAAYREAIALWEKLVVEDHDYRVELGGTWLRLADFYTLNPRAKEPEKSYQESAAVFEKLYADFPNDPWPAHELGYIYLILAQILEVSKEADRQQEAERVSRRSVTLYEGLVAKHPNVPDYQVRLIWCYRVLAIILRHRGKPQEALELYRDKLTILKKLNTDSIPATELNELSWNLVSCSEPKLRDPIEVELAEKALKKEPLNPPYWNTLGVALYRAGQWQAAVAALKKSNDLLPGSEFSLAGYRDDGGWRPPPPPNVNGFFLAMAYWQLDEKERARQWYAPAILWMEKYNPKNEELRRFRAEAAALLGVPEHSPHPRQEDQHDDVKIYSLILQANPAAAWAYHLRGRIHERRGQAQQAEADYRHAIQLYTRALEANPDQATGWRNRGAAYAERSQWEKAAADYAKATELAPEEAVFWYWDGLARLGAGDLVGYRRACAAMLERFGQTKNPAAAHWVAWGCALASKAASDPEQPVRLAEEALAHEPNNQQYLDTLGAALYRAGRFADAIQRFSRLIAARDQAGTKPLYSPAYTEFFLAMAHHRLGHAAEARHWLDKGVKSMDMETGQKAQIATTGAPIPWNRRLTLQLLRREAEELSKKGISP